MNTAAEGTDLIRGLTLDRLVELLHTRGYRVERASGPAGVAVLRSATGGLGFEIRPGTRLSPDADSFVDLTCSAALKVEGQLNLAVPNAWNNARRYARLHLQGDVLVLSQDISLAGAVDAVHVITQFEIWDRQLQDLPGFLRQEIARLQPQIGASVAGPDGSAATASAA